MATFRRWAQEKGLRPSETRYTRRAREGTVDLRFSKSGVPAIEKNYRTHCVSPALSERKQQQIAERFDRAAKPVVFLILRESQCSECGAELGRDGFLFMEAEQPLCLPCARLGDVEYVPSGGGARKGGAGMRTRCRSAGQRAGARSRRPPRTGSQTGCPDDETDSDSVSRLSAEGGGGYRRPHRRAKQQPRRPDRGRPEPGRAGSDGRRNGRCSS